MGRTFGMCPVCGEETFDDIPCANGCEFHDTDHINYNKKTIEYYNNIEEFQERVLAFVKKWHGVVGNKGIKELGVEWNEETGRWEVESKYRKVVFNILSTEHS